MSDNGLNGAGRAESDHPEFGFTLGHMNNGQLNNNLDGILRSARRLMENDVRAERRPVYQNDEEYIARLKEKALQVLEAMIECVNSSKRCFSFSFLKSFFEQINVSILGGMRARLAYLLPSIAPGINPGVGFATRPRANDY